MAVDIKRVQEAIGDFLQETARIRKMSELLPIQHQLVKHMKRVFSKQESIFLTQFERYRDRFSESIDANELDGIIARVTLETQEEMGKGIMAASGKAMELAAKHRIVDMALNISFDLKNPRAMQWLADNAALKVTRINEVTRDSIATILKHGVKEGWSYNQTAKEIKNRFEEFRIGKPQQHIQSRAHLVAITESANAYEAGNKMVIDQMTEVGLVMEKKWLTVGDNRVSDGCDTNQNDGWILADQPHSSGDMHPPRFPGCLPGDQIVIAKDILGATKRLFDGELVIVNTARGNKFSCTPNHPILTPHGWVAAGLLNEGDELVCANGIKRMLLSPDVDYEYMPAPIEKIVNAFRLRNKFAPHPVEVTPPDFHGDGNGSKVAIVWANSPLGNSIDIGSSQNLSDSIFPIPNVTRFYLSAKSHFTSLFKRMFATCRRFMRSIGESGILLWCALCGQKAICLQSSTQGNADFYQSFADKVSANSIIPANGSRGLATIVAADDIADRQIDAHGIGFGKVAMASDASGNQPSRDSGLANLKLSSELVLLLPSQIFTDKVIDTRRRQFSGHVYNLQTRCEYYITSTVIMHNCRCDELYQRRRA